MPGRLTQDEKDREAMMLVEWRRTRPIYITDHIPRIDIEEHGFCIEKQFTDAYSLAQYNKVFFPFPCALDDVFAVESPAV